MIGTVTDSLLSLIYPQNCRVCNGPVESRNDGVACSDCWNKTRFFNGSELLCSKCGAYFGEKSGGSSVRCIRCHDHHYEKAFALGVYEKALSATIISLKSTPAIPRRLRAILHSFPETSSLPCDLLIIPVPLSRRRMIERGYNQAEVVARELGRICHFDVDAASLVRSKHTSVHRIGMDQRARELSLVKAFEVVRPKLIAGRNILLVDDVLTSGSTVSECSRVLKKSGANDVFVFTLARAVMH